MKIPQQRRPLGLPTLILGAGEAGRALARDLARVESFGLDPIGFLDDDVDLRGADLEGRAWLGFLDSLEIVIQETGAQVVVIAIPSMPHPQVHAIAVRAASLGVKVRHLPPFLAALQREVAGTDMRALPVGSLIGRQEMHVAGHAVAGMLAGKRVLVTGAGGSIGSELCRQVAAFGPATLVMLDHDESNLHRMLMEIWGEASLDQDSVVVADIRDRSRIHQVFRDVRPQVVFHAAALKHLPVLERHPCEGVKSNVQGTENLVQAAIAHDAERFILISTDKAADPVSVLGATKRLAEILLETYSGSECALAAVRFGNVLGSRGSLLHVLREQMVSADPVTVTDPDATRFFMTIEEAVGLVLEAMRMAEHSGTFVLDMGQPVRILDLVTNFAALLGVSEPHVRFTGLRPGEKLHEELFCASEVPVATDHPRIMRAPARRSAAGFRSGLLDLYDAARHNRPEEVVEHLRKLVPEYAPGLQRVGVAPVPAVPYPDDY